MVNVEMLLGKEVVRLMSEDTPGNTDHVVRGVVYRDMQSQAEIILPAKAVVRWV